uniref:Uncharacterized protein n=1 Tax=Acidithiobacillus ferrooxidans TaxID=920 RepID=Q5PU83_ACIFR|nr:unknown [Acidithiobacillus ferrooxidans]
MENSDPALFCLLQHLEAQSNEAVARYTIFCARRPVAHSGKGRLNGIGGADVSPMFGRIIIESQQLGSILFQLGHGLGILRLVVAHKDLQGFLCGLPALGHPDFLECRLRLTLLGFGQFVEDIGGLVHPAALLAGFGIRFIQCCPEAHGAITNSQ